MKPQLPSTSSFTNYRQKIDKKGQVTKISSEFREKKEKRETLAQLHQLVPTVPKNESVSKLELLQHVMDYIFQLQTQLREDNGDENHMNDSTDFDDLQTMMQLFTASDNRHTSFGLC